MSSDDEGEQLSFGLFGDLLDEMHQDISDQPTLATRRATQKEFDVLCKLIGGFEKWSVLNEDCRREVVKNMDYWTRSRLGTCSKADHETVNTTPIKVHSIEVQDNESHYVLSPEDFDNVLVRVQFHHDFNSGKRFELVFSQLGEDTQIRWVKYMGRADVRSLILKNCNYYEEATKFAEKWMKRCNFEIAVLKVEMSQYPMASSIIKFLPCCKDLRIAADDLDAFRWWLQKVPEQLDSLQLLTHEQERNTLTLPGDFVGLPQIMTVPSLYFWCRAAFSDEQFLELKAKSMSFNAVNITDNGINQFLKNWINGKGVPGFSRALLWSRRQADKPVLIRGFEVRQWEGDFEREASGFCGDFERVCGRGDCLQVYSLIDPYESLTLSIMDDRISIYATGWKCTYDGRTYSDYGIP
ncbi:F-box associated domain-containing protein [Caenorhabditis elegans]|uniref:F-box associated domain-containing protein n=2 Tax=Caenorhabditis elegans TaxID=6239 RepID=H2L087_CAEEL|nr:F-box associated domain-containing protein [Caenorhabditis elegans]CCD72041.1 F-box associated domain-containing protein [Caenorhabditis elegans]|eukprot:NP_504640.1 Uncharacterized protein CELE_T05H4.15 [Caenorhabditis elegans]